MKTWEVNYLGLFNYKERNQLYFYFKFLRSSLFKNLRGDVVESGVFKGKSLITAALLFKKLKIKKKIWGYDTFEGFPEISEKDNFNNFKILRQKKKISSKHYNDVLKLKKYFTHINNLKINPNNISSSKNFSDTNIKFLKKKISYLKVNNLIYLVEGEFKKTMTKENNLPKKISAGLIDCDLYGGYQISLKCFWPKLQKNGRLFLDEYYSLKFPGARLAVDEFVSKNKDAKLIFDGVTLGFERWSLKKI